MSDESSSTSQKSKLAEADGGERGERGQTTHSPLPGILVGYDSLYGVEFVHVHEHFTLWYNREGQRSTEQPPPTRTHPPYTFPWVQTFELFPHRSWLGPILVSRKPRYMKRELAVGTAEHTNPFFLRSLPHCGRLPRCNVMTYYLCACIFGREKWAIIRTAAMASQTSTSEQSLLETPPSAPAREKVQ